jgi:cob(I)alamin adenosyltransferase
LNLQEQGEHGDDIPSIEGFIDEITANLELPKEFVCPDRTDLGLLDVARTVVRRAERVQSHAILQIRCRCLSNRLFRSIVAMARWQEGEPLLHVSVK